MARLDVELVRRGLARSRAQAAQLIADGKVRRGGQALTKPSSQAAEDDELEVLGADHFVSRAAHKLKGALEDFDAHELVRGRRCLDVGASTGGFTQVLLEAGAAQVVAVDVGHDQLVGSLRSDERVVCLEGTNARDLTSEAIGGTVDLVVADVSFISLTLVLPAVRDCVRPGGDLFLMIKPQFELQRGDLDGHGVVRSENARAKAIRSVASRAVELGFGVESLAASRLPGPSGNLEYFLWLTAPDDSTAPGERSETTPMLAVDGFLESEVLGHVAAMRAAGRPEPARRRGRDD